MGGPSQECGPFHLLQAEESAATRDKLQRELEALGSDEELMAWATRILPIKNSLRSHDALAIEQAFATKMAGLNLCHPTLPPTLPAPIWPTGVDRTRAKITKNSPPA